MMTTSKPTFLHSLDTAHDAMPKAFTFPFRYTPHPLCLRAAEIVKDYLDREGLTTEGKMYGVLVVEGGFLAAYSGQLCGTYAHPWFVPPVFDYLNPESYFQKEQAEIVGLSEAIEASDNQSAAIECRKQIDALAEERREAVETAKDVYERGKKARAAQRLMLSDDSPEARSLVAEMEGESQYQKAEIRRAKQKNDAAIKALEVRLGELETKIRRAKDERRQRSEALQQWLFEQFHFRNGRGEQRSLPEIFGTYHADNKVAIPSGAGECCAPKLLNAAFALGLKPLAMAEFWWGPAPADAYRQTGVFYPACNRKCRPILSFMLQGLDVEPDPAQHYERAVGEVQVLWEDAWMAVVSKPAGWLSVPGKTDLPDVQQWARSHWSGLAGPVVVHRLDQDTSGLMILAKTQMSYGWLQRMFELRQVHKRYVALLEGHWQHEEMSGTISLPLAPDYDDLPRQRVDRELGLEAVTRYEVLGNEALREDDERPVTRVAFFPLTGRTHQLRMHASSPEGLGMPIVGDRLYGQLARRLYLHAEALDFVHPATGEKMHFELPAPFANNGAKRREDVS